MGSVPCIYSNLPTYQANTHKPQYTMKLHKHKKPCKTESYTTAFLETELADGTSRYVTKTVNWCRLGDTVIRLGARKLQPHLQEK